MSIVIKCDFCGKERVTYPSQTHEKNFCNSECYHKWRKTLVGELGYNWKGGKITKTCVRCGKKFKIFPSSSHHTHCSQACANRDLADAQKGIPNPLKGHNGEHNWAYGKGYLYKGELNPNWGGGTTKANAILRTVNRYYKWRDKVFIRDDYTCQDCGKRGGNLHAHHIKSFAEYPDLRFDVDNGLTLCVKCHRKTFKKTKP